MDGEEVSQNVLSVKVSIHIKANEPINLLRKEIISGKLGKFKVAAFPDKFKGVAPPIYYLFQIMNLHSDLGAYSLRFLSILYQ